MIDNYLLRMRHAAHAPGATSYNKPLFHAVLEVNRHLALFNISTILLVGTVALAILAHPALALAVLAISLGLRLYSAYVERELIEDRYDRMHPIRLLGIPLWVPLLDVRIAWFKGDRVCHTTSSSAWGTRVTATAF